MKKKLVAVGLVAVMMMASVQVVGATPLSDAQSKKSKAQSDLSSINSQISQIESQQAALQTEIDALDADLVQVLVDIDIIEGEIEEKKAELAQAEEDLEAAREKETEQYDAMKERIRFMYENGDVSFLDALVGADSFADVLNKIENFSMVYSYDRMLLVEYQNTKAEVQSLVERVEEEEAELEENELAYEEQKANLETMKAEKSSQMDDFDSQLASAQKLASQYKATISEANSIIMQQTVSTSNIGVTAGASSVSSSSSSTSTASGTGAAVAAYACQFVGNPYKYGGTSLTDGADCSGFVMSVYAHFGVSLPHSSSAMRSVGRSVSVSDMQPGDIVCYSGHVAIYIGGGQIVHASSPSTGIKISSAYYKTIITVRRIF